jgi:anti-sigma B factor antagonist
VEITIHAGQAGTPIVEVTGELDIYTAPRLREQLLRLADDEDEAPARVLLDLNKVSFIDSTGLGAIVGAHRRFTQTGATLELVCGHCPVQRLLAITRLDQVFRVHDRIPTANTA